MLIHAVRNFETGAHAAEYNPMEFVKTNIHGAENVVLSSINSNVKKVTELSQPINAANPINLYMALLNLPPDKIFIASE